jgi:hypothetical protein
LTKPPVHHQTMGEYSELSLVEFEKAEKPKERWKQ